MRQVSRRWQARKSWDVELCMNIGIDEGRANEIGVRLFKVGCPWPLDIEHIRDFARGL